MSINNGRETTPENDKGTLIVKVSSKVLARTEKDGSVRPDICFFRRLGGQIINTRKNHNVALVTSGAIALAMAQKRLKKPPKDIEQIQWLACKGQPRLHREWERSFKGVGAGQVLLTDTELSRNTNERTQALRTIRTGFDQKEIPVINEDDARSHKEISFGDNDILAAILAARIKESSDFSDPVRLLMLTDTNGICENWKDPSTRIPLITDLSEYQHLFIGEQAEQSDSEISKGGLKSKRVAVEIAKSAGVDVWVANGRTPNVIERALNSEVGTYFPAAQIPVPALDQQAV